MDVAHGTFALDERQRGEEAFLFLSERLARPSKGRAGRFIEIAAASLDGPIVVALDNRRALRGIAGDHLDDCARVRTVAYEIAEKREAFRTATARVDQAGVQGFQVAMNVGQQSCQHESALWLARAYPSILTSPKTPAAVYAVGLM